MPHIFSVGEHVRWAKTLCEDCRNAKGRVVRIIPSDSSLPEFVIYEIQFEFGLRTLFCNQLEPAEHQTETLRQFEVSQGNLDGRAPEAADRDKIASDPRKRTVRR